MGAIHFSIDPVLAAILASRLELTVFIETGTFQGDSVASVRRCFQDLHTCELSPELYAAATRRFAGDPAVHCHLGSSPARLRALARDHTDRPVMYWLDAHWCSADHAAGQESQCPLLAELDAIAPLHPHSVVWIDDARYFMAPPPAPLEVAGWPTFQQVLDRLRSLSSTHELVVANDTLLLHPAAVAGEIAAYLHAHGADWLAIAHASRSALERSAPSRLPPEPPWPRSLLTKCSNSIRKRLPTPPKKPPG
jgi:hypothetical protein